MSEENKDVKQEVESQTTEEPSTEEKEQESVEETQPVEEDVKTQETDSEEVKETEPAISQDAIEKENYKRALQKEREKFKKLQEENKALAKAQTEAKTETLQPQVSEPDSTDDINQQWHEMRADVYLTKKMQEDPSFRDRVEFVKQEMESDPSLTAEMADMKVKTRLFDEMISEENQEPVKPIKQIKSTATPEPTKPTSENPLKDAREGNIEFEDAKELQTALNTHKA